ncbi:MAG: hypothetical protein JSS53_00680 [Proteobacteria bacterium]|nr:hypothetical protein [Pseudomonadota bacterium]
MFFNTSKKRILKQKIMQLKNPLLHDGSGDAHFFTLELDKKVPIESKSRWNTFLSFREYLTDLVDANYKKAAAIYDLLQVFSENSKNKLSEKLSEQRGWIKSEKTVGQQIFEQICSPHIDPKIIDEKYSLKLESSNPIHRVPSSYSLSAQIKNNDLLTAIRLFDDVPPSHYRRGIYVSSHQMGGTITLDFPQDISEDNLPGVTDKNLTEASTRPVPKLPLRGKVNEWIPLTTLTINDRISDFKAEFLHKLGYSKSAKQYYVMPLAVVENDTYEVSYKLHAGKQPIIECDSQTQLSEVEQVCLSCLRDFQFNHLEKENVLKSHFSSLSLDRKLIVLQIFFHEFEDENLTQHYEASTVLVLNLMLKEKKGVCAQRAVICREIAEILGLNLPHTVVNDVHEFCELENYRVDLGGGNRNILEYAPDLKLSLQPSLTATLLTTPNLPTFPLAVSICLSQAIIQASNDSRIQLTTDTSSSTSVLKPLELKS